jgi:predicted nucleic acid-binding protein
MIIASDGGTSTDWAVPETAVVVDTDVYSWLFVRQRQLEGAELQRIRDRLVGRMVVIAIQTRAELLVWPLLQQWGESRKTELAKRLTATPTLPVSADVCDCYVRLTVQCKRLGHALGDKMHTGDRWVAASAIALGRPLMTLDGIYRDAPGLDLL